MKHRQQSRITFIEKDGILYPDLTLPKQILEPKLWHQISRLYFCKVNPTKDQCNYTENEIKSGFGQVLYSIEDALEKSKRVLEKEGVQAWNQREYKSLLLIRDHLRSSISTTSGLSG